MKTIMTLGEMEAQDPEIFRNPKSSEAEVSAILERTAAKRKAEFERADKTPQWIAYGDAVYGPFANWSVAVDHAETQDWFDFELCESEREAWEFIENNESEK